MNKFKVGDEIIADYFGEKRKGTIIEIGNRHCYTVRVSGISGWFICTIKERNLILANKNEIKGTFKGTYTDKEVTFELNGKTAIAKCSPDNKFDLATGIKVALDKLNKPKLTDDEKVILRNIDNKNFKYIAKDKYGNIFIYNDDTNDLKNGLMRTIENYRCLDMFNSLFKFIKDNTYEIKKLLEE